MADDFFSLNKEALKNVEAIKSSVTDIKSEYTAVNRSLQRQGQLLADSKSAFSDITRSANQFAKLQQEAEKSASGTAKAIKEQEKNLNVVKQLNAQIENLYEQQGKTKNRFVNDTLQRQIRNLSNARDSAKELANEYGRMAEDSAKLDGSTAFFSQFSEIIKDIPGLRKLSGPFEAAAKASRETVISNAKASEIKKRLSKLTAEELKTGKGLTKERIKSLNLEDITQGKSGGHALKLLKNAKAQAKTQSAFIAGGKAGFKALGGVISKAFAPLAIAKVILDVLKFFVEAAFAANTQVTQMAKQFTLSFQEATNVRNTLIEMKHTMGSVYATTENLVVAMNEFLELSKLNLFPTREELQAQILITKQLGLQGAEAANLNKIFAVQNNLGKDGLDITQDTIVEFANENKMLFNQSKILSEMSKVSGQILINFRGSTKELAKSVMEAAALGINLETARGMSNSLLNFEQSITDELSAELLIGRDINLERARLAALNGDYAGAATEIFKTIGGINEFSKMNVIQQEALAKAAGLTVDQLSDAFIQQKFQGTETGDQIKRLRQAGAIDKANRLAAGKLSKEDLEVAMNQVSAAETFKQNLQKAKEIFSDLVSGGTLQDIADALTGIANSTIFQYFGSEEREKRIQSGMDKLEEKVVQGTATAKERAKYKEMQALKEEQFGVGGAALSVGGGAAAGALIGSAFGGVGAIPGSIIGGLIGLLGGGANVAIQEGQESRAEKKMDELIGAVNNQTQTLQNTPPQVALNGTSLNQVGIPTLNNVRRIQ